MASCRRHGPAPRISANDRAIFVCEGGELRYNNMRRFGGIWLARDREERDRLAGPLRPDAAHIGQRPRRQR